MPAVMEPERSSQMLRPLVDAWIGKIAQAKQAKEEFNAIASQCNAFYSQDTSAMWKPGFRSRYLGQIGAPSFRVSINKAFELVAVFGPFLFWRYPQRNVTSEQPEPIFPELFGLTPEVQQQGEQLMQQMQMLQSDPAAMQDPAAQQQLAMIQQQLMPIQQMHQQMQQAQQQQYMEQVFLDARSRLMTRYLNYSQREQPGGGLSFAAEIAITEALVKGRGVLWPRTYRFPGSNRLLTGLFADTVDNLLIDPDCNTPDLRSATWIAQRHLEPVWRVERKFKMPRGALKKAATIESGNSKAGKSSDADRHHRTSGQTYDLVEWWEIWSKGGAGHRLNQRGEELPGIHPGLAQAFDEVVGDYAYLCVTENMPFPLNAPAALLEGVDDDSVQEMFQWRCSDYGERFPAYLDDRWPVAVLDFYPLYKSAWPLSPLGPALGELIALNVLTAAFVEQSYTNRQMIIAVLKSASQDVEEALKSNRNPVYVPINDAAQRSISDLIQFLQRPSQNPDIIGAIKYLEELFNKRTGLSEVLYAMNTAGTQSRTARDIAAKQEAAGIRPDKMAMDTAKWMASAAQLEMFLAGWSVKGEDIGPLLGPHGVMLWDQLITGSDPELWVRQFKVTVDANDLKKPNKEREYANLSTMMGYTLPMLQMYAQITGDSAPVNNYLTTIAESIDQDASGWQMGPWLPGPPPPPPPEVAQHQAQMAELELADKQMDVTNKSLDAEIKKVEVAAKQIEAGMQGAMGQAEGQKKQMELFMDAAKKQQDIQAKQASSSQKLIAERARFLQQLSQKEDTHEQQSRHKEEAAVLDMELKRAQGRAAAKAKREATGNGKQK